MKFKFFIISILLCIATFSCQQNQSNSNSNNNTFNEIVVNRVMLFNWVDSVDTSTQEHLLELFKGLPTKVEGFEYIKINELSNSKDGYEHVLNLGFSSKEGIENYEKHDDHLQIQELAPPLVSGFLLYEY